MANFQVKDLGSDSQPLDTDLFLKSSISGSLTKISFSALKTAVKDQSAVGDPSASGTSMTFIASISQNAQGVISPAKKTIATGTTASSVCVGNDARLSNSRTPTAHAATSTAYGAGNASNYGHVKLTDTFATRQGGNANASKSIGASAYAVQEAYQKNHIYVGAVEITSGTVSNGNKAGTVTAPIDQYSEFLCWLQPSTSGFVGALYMEDPTSKSSNVWSAYGTATLSPSGSKVICRYLWHNTY